MDTIYIVYARIYESEVLAWLEEREIHIRRNSNYKWLNFRKNGKPASEITAEYDLSPASIHNWVRAYKHNGNVQVESKLTLEQKEIIDQNKRIRQLEMENDILKQAALIMGRK